MFGPFFHSFTPSLRALAGSSDLTLTAAAPLVGIGSLAGVAALTFGGTNTIQASGSLAGASALVFSSTDTIQATGTLAGASALVFTPAAPIVAIGTLAGSAAEVFSLSAPLLGSGVLAGSAAAIFGGTDPLSGIGALVGSSDLSFTATLETPVIISPMVGISALIFQQTVQPTLSAASQPGLVSMSFSLSATLDGLGERGMSDRIDLTRTSYGSNWFSVLTPVVKSMGGITLATGATFGLAGALTGKGALAGVSDEVFSAAAVVGGIGALAGTCALSFSAIVTAPGAISGVSALTFSAVAAPLGVIGGSCDLSFGHGASALTGVGHIIGQSLLQIGVPPATIRVTGLVGVSSMSFSLIMGEHPSGISEPLRKGYNVFGASSFYILHPMSKIATALISVPIDMSFSLTATARALASISGVSALTFGGVGVMRGATGGLTSFEFIPLGLIRGIGALAGACNISFGAGESSLSFAQKTTGESNIRFSLRGHLTTTGWTHKPPRSGNWTPKTPLGDGWTHKAPVTSTWVKKTGT